MGEIEGTRVAYIWTPASLFPRLVPWLALLALLALKRNRAAGAWWIWAGVLGGFAMETLLRAPAGLIPSQPLDALAEALEAMNFGLAAVWLLSGYLAWKHRFLSFLAILGIGLVFGMGCNVLGQFDSNGLGEAILGGVIVAMNALIISVALSLAGLVNRRRYRPVRLLVWSTVLTIAAATLIVAPFFIMATLGNPGRVPVKEFLQGLGLLAGMNLALVLVYLLLSFVTGFYRQRLIGLLQLGTLEPPPVISPEPAPELAAAK